MDMTFVLPDSGFLASSDEISALLATFPHARRSTRSPKEFDLPASSARPPRTESREGATTAVLRAGHKEESRTAAPRIREGRCSCGNCARCLDDARWERIFNEKFADPGYYGGLKVRQGSTLA